VVSDDKATCAASRRMTSAPTIRMPTAFARQAGAACMIGRTNGPVPRVSRSGASDLPPGILSCVQQGDWWSPGSAWWAKLNHAKKHRDELQAAFGLPKARPGAGRRGANER
jgi:hypothetical protein